MLAAGFLTQFASRRYGSNRNHQRADRPASQHRREHVNFESAQVTGAARVAMVGRTKVKILSAEPVRWTEAVSAFSS